MKLIDDWQSAWRLHSVQIAAIGATAAGVWVALPDEQQQAILAQLGIKPGWAVVVGFAAVIVGRLRAQP